MERGRRKAESGSVEDRRDGSWHPVESMRDAVRHGICYVPRDRKNEGLFGGLSVLDNYSLPTLPRWARLTFIDRKGLGKKAEQDLNVMRTRYPGLKAPVGRLSGGNQQKVLLARWLAVGPELMILDDPLRGVDAATKVEVYQVFQDLAAQGVTLLGSSSTKGSRYSGIVNTPGSSNGNEIRIASSSPRLSFSARLAV